MKINRKYFEKSEVVVEESKVIRQIVLEDSNCHGAKEYAEWEDDKAHYFVGKDGKVYALRGHDGEDVVRVALEALHGTNMPDWELTLWYEYCSQCRYRGLQYWDYYTGRQLDGLRELLMALNKDMMDWNADPRLGDRVASRGGKEGAPGVYLRGTVVDGQVGCHPQPELLRVIREVCNKKKMKEI